MTPISVLAVLKNQQRKMQKAKKKKNDFIYRTQSNKYVYNQI